MSGARPHTPVTELRGRQIGLAGFAEARWALAVELGIHEGEKAGAWRLQPPAVHAWHALGHFVAALVLPFVGRRHLVRMHLTHGACRALMALEQFIAAFGREVGRTTCPPSKGDVR